MFSPRGVGLTPHVKIWFIMFKLGLYLKFPLDDIYYSW
jgi:hypothetical protein